MKKPRSAPSETARGSAWIAGFVLLIWARRLSSLFARFRRKVLGARARRPDTVLPSQIPKTVWIYWDKGEAAAPTLVQACIASWRHCNPGWQVRVLSATDIPAETGLSAERAQELPPQAFSDLLRLRLLRTHGGVWADATLYCVVPLDHWLPVVAGKGFFAFSWTRDDAWMIWPNLRRRLTNWFLASEPEGTVITTWESYASAYLHGRAVPHVYYWPHLLVDWLTLRHRDFARALGAMPRLGAYGPHLVHDCITRHGDDAAVTALLRAGVAPVQKLRWKWDAETSQRALAMLGDDLRI